MFPGGVLFVLQLLPLKNKFFRVSLWFAWFLLKVSKKEGIGELYCSQPQDNYNFCIRFWCTGAPERCNACIHHPKATKSQWADRIHKHIHSVLFQQCVYRSQKPKYSLCVSLQGPYFNFTKGSLVLIGSLKFTLSLLMSSLIRIALKGLTWKIKFIFQS